MLLHTIWSLERLFAFSCFGGYFERSGINQRLCLIGFEFYNLANLRQRTENVYFRALFAFDNVLHRVKGLANKNTLIRYTRIVPSRGVNYQ